MISWKIKDGYPKTGTGIKQVERIARFVARSKSNPFVSSDKCIDKIMGYDLIGK